ncbi:CDP-glycerol glycerophosphotransferase family protein [Streptomyces erythrochromogenes]|uniref:Bifunctional glycosyltransferase family 2 protein/CDP-glycerol:glycerophosphate glycerophosphotransferase n=1 Tax=Streptomyces erythrochromogenes TaxID=285574 RepID=A0ABZ1QEW4_9ACTN|nr:bifunctional glycosyltransferase family 2 protein/CDP-glycerol:glycerophosphate glycerophosphotransferase [Streptomyces erythrochromogenes]MCX5586512.1 bifunctional glycosyltransferase family 2 protein/CDP-glycerol:glycerophosphate glycerophosphotransferase [Streptomyces erythrochromogenes]
MPRFSVIVPAYKVQAYLQESLDSVLTQSYPDLELIAVDDASPDACGSIIDEYAARDPRVTAVHLAHNLGLGPARNAGLVRATGDYLIFLDGDDTLAPGALQALTDRLKATGSPDVLVYDYARAYWSGELVRNRLSHRLSEEGPASFRLADRPALLAMLMVVWNKAYRREYIEREGLEFPPGLYEDTPWTYPAMLAAESVAVLDRVCVHYRQRRTGSILTTSTPRHLEIFDQYERVFGYLAGRPELERWRSTLHRRMAEHFCAVHSDTRRLPRASRAEFFARASALLRRYRAPGARSSLPLSLSRTDRIRHALMRLGARRSYRMLSVLRSAGLALGRAATALGRGLRESSVRLHYRIQRLLPLRPELAVFSAYWHGGYACNPAAIEAKLRELAPRMRTAWICDPAHAATLPRETVALRPGSAAYWSALARAGYLVTNVNFDRALVKRPGQILLQTQHGTPLKRVGLDLQDRPAATPTADFAGLLRGADQWDYLLSANRHSTLVWEKAVPSSYTTLEYGYPRNDVFHRASRTDVLELRERLGIPAGSTAILYAPTHRDYRRSRPDHLDFERLLRDLGPRFTVLVRTHLTYADADRTWEPHPRLVDVSSHPSVEELCLASDALVTDYSSLMFDYAALDRPIVIHADDWEAYEAARGTYFDLRSCPPGAIARTQDELVDIFTTGHWQGSRSAQLRSAFRARFCSYDDGHAAERVVRRVFLGQTTPSPAIIPLPDRHPAPPAPAPASTAAPEPTLAHVWP